MKKIAYKYMAIGMLGSAMLLNSCSKNFLNTTPETSISSAQAWTDGALSEAFVTNAYNGLGNGGWYEQELASLTDEAVFVHPGRNINIVNEGTLSPSNLGWVDDTYNWGLMYQYIRACNVSLENLKTATFPDTVLNNRLQGEAHFLRAYYYQQLLRYYGGVPLVAHSYGLNQDYSIARSSYADCVKFISADCDTAVGLLTGKKLVSGRATPVAALALKSRVLLYAASDLHDVPTAKAKSSVLSAYSNPELLGYVSGDRNARWQAAKDAAMAAINAANAAGNSGYMLNLGAPAAPAVATQNYISVAMGGGSKAPGVDAAAGNELIFVRQFAPAAYSGGPGTDGTSVGLDNGPNGYHNWSGNIPVQQLVDDYEMMDGTKFDWTNPVEAAHPYANRDPRFYASILYDGAPWKPRDKIGVTQDPANQIQTGYYETAPGVLTGGLDTRQSAIENWNASWSGYNMRKFIDPDPNIVDNNTRQFIPFPFIRYTELVFNYAEACIELGQYPEAQNWLNKIRFRAGMPAITLTGDALRQEYRNERRVELAFEEHRYHDARRWMIAPATLGRKLLFINVTGKLRPGQTALSPYKHDENVYSYTYVPYNDNGLENRTWLDKMYFRPLALDEVNKNQKLIQNPGY
ncbi:RagB/SusD family nutrient uptake outer membrane protein [Niabella soli]|uniref:Carbohydrate-binding protein SusD n=1 Tax=Niabella soli DSM 19437 TaxID=929713 RepID=W0F447_9BACT|nr:RagB/SusD family nutrient uptake outer membrane protein [Niabella soli]AHF16126.1 carbohydrate-binding protein SusD [Niabella soli DSM 19437]